MELKIIYFFVYISTFTHLLKNNLFSVLHLATCKCLPKKTFHKLKMCAMEFINDILFQYWIGDK